MGDVFLGEEFYSHMLLTVQVCQRRLEIFMLRGDPSID